MARALPGHTHDAYECCGKAAGQYGRRRGAICRDCERLIADGRKWQAHEAMTTASHKVVSWTERSWAFPGWHNNGVASDTDRALRAAFFDVVNLLVQDVPASRYMDRTTEHLIVARSGRLEWVRLVVIAPVMLEAARALYTAIEEALRSAYQGGQRRGASILMQLAEGEATLSEFNKAALGVKDE